MSNENNHESFYGDSNDGRFIRKCYIGVGLLIGGLIAPKGFDVLGLPIVGKLMEVAGYVGGTAVIGSEVFPIIREKMR